MFPLMDSECNRFRCTMIHLYAFLDALLRVLEVSRAWGKSAEIRRNPQKSAEIRRNPQKSAEIRRNTQAKTPINTQKYPSKTPQAKTPQAKTLTPTGSGFFALLKT